MVGWGREVLAPPVAVANPLTGLRLPPPASVSREEKEEEGAQGVWGKGRGPALVPRSRLAAGAWSCCPTVRLEAEEMVFREGKRRKGAEGRRKEK